MRIPDAPLETPFSWHVAALAGVMLFPTATTLVYFVVLSGDESMSLLYGASKVVQFAFPLAWVLLVQRRRLRWAAPAARPLLWGVAFGLAASAAGLAAYFGYFKSSLYFEAAPQLVAGKITDMRLTTPVRYWAFAAFLAVPHSLLEEYYWRWFAFGQLRRVMSPWPAIVLSSLGFMAHHVIVVHAFLQGPWWLTAFFSLCVAFGGGVWAWLYARFGSLYAPWVSHFLLDVTIMAIGYDLAPWPLAG